MRGLSSRDREALAVIAELDRLIAELKGNVAQMNAILTAPVPDAGKEPASGS